MKVCAVGEGRVHDEAADEDREQPRRQEQHGKGAIEGQLAAQNRDYQEAMTEYPALMVPIVELHARGEGPFAGDADRIKHRYVG